ncbi:RBT4 [Symbiodinium natans]|uniref:RBT4 protein n=1 Tax=Symbiodinium natans TaxID=878477 RepID=A0A812N6M8_9DINO|nr:RBT4 [Symbiodinium natans]
MPHLEGHAFALLWYAGLAAAFQSSQTNCAANPAYVGDHIVPLCAVNFPEKSSTTYASWVVHFYAGNCRHCRELAVTLQKAVSAPAMLKKGVKVGAVDCHDASNANLCRGHKVWKFPVLMILSSGSRYTGPLDTAAMVDWMSEVSEPGLLPPMLQKMSVCPAFHLYEEPQLAREFLMAHNIYRCAAGIDMLEWDMTAFQTARSYAQKAPTDRLAHSKPSERRGKHGATFGENVAIGEHLWPGQVVARWYDEIRNTQGGKFRPNRAGLGHYTQIVWRKTRKVGCSFGQNRRVAICHYDPAGNERGKHLSQVAPPLPGFFGREGQERCGAVVEEIGAP